MSHSMQSVCAILTALTLLGVAAQAQDKSTYYTVMHPGEFKIDWNAFYEKAEEMTAAVRKELPHRLDIAYGEEAKQKLDVYRPVGNVSGAPVFVFLHGGGMREGDRAQYGYVARPFAKHGIVTVVASYGLTPKFRYPDQPRDVAHVLAWVHAHIKDSGGDPARIFLGGHSAGALLTATAGLNARWVTALSLPATLIKGLVLISGSYDLRARKDYEYADAAHLVEASPLLNIDRPSPQSIVAYGSAEAQLAGPSRAIADRVREKGGHAELLVLDEMEHHDTVWALGDEQSPLFQAVLRMIMGRDGASHPGD